ncbi:MAG TPA: restriction endonuclease [Rhizomicrobium sp.]|nr:restriction endonuclease [Rhizomicrobium sp.]
MSSAWVSDLVTSDLLVDKIYVGGRQGNASDDPLPHLLGVSNQGGFRYLGHRDKPILVLLTSSFSEADWPDDLDRQSGIFTYFGDNRTAGEELHKTKRFGNLILRDIYERRHGARELWPSIPPVFVFANLRNSWRDVRFLGLAVPGAEGLTSNDDLVAVWRQRQGKRFQNYRAKLTILDAGRISRHWLNDIKQGDVLSESCPVAWKAWVQNGIYHPLKAPRVLEYRKKEEQLPAVEDRPIIEAIKLHFQGDEVRFESCAAKIAELMLPRIVSLDITRPSRDGGRDGIGKYQLGDGPSAVLVDFALEAKCYGWNSSVGVEDLSRLISRLRHRQFGVLVTTSIVADQAYKEIKDDQHPIIIICAADIVRLLKSAGVSSIADLANWLSAF